MLRNIRSILVPSEGRGVAVESRVVTAHNCPARFLQSFRHADMYAVLRTTFDNQVWLWKFDTILDQTWASVLDLKTSGISVLPRLDKDIRSLEDIADGILCRCPHNIAVEEFHAYFSEYPTVQEACAS